MTPSAGRCSIWSLVFVCVALASLLLGCGSPRSAPTGSPTQPEGPSQPQAQPLSETSAVALDLTAPDAYQRTWVARVDKCQVSTAADGALVCEVVGSSDTSGGQYGGVRFEVGSAKAVQVEVTFTRPDNIVGAFMDLVVGTDRNDRVRWQATARDAGPLPTGRQTFTFRPDQATGPFEYAGGSAKLADVTHAHFFIRIRPGSSSGFRIHRVLVER